MTPLVGGCACRAVTFICDDPAPRPVVACHCKQCRRFTGYTYAATAVKKACLTLAGEENLTWYQSSDLARRGFCKICGSALFWDNQASPGISIAAGSIDNEAELKFGWHIYVDDQPRYYQLVDECLKYAVREDGPTR